MIRSGPDRHASEAELLALDAALDRLAQHAAGSGDEVLPALARYVQHVDARAARLIVATELRPAVPRAARPARRLGPRTHRRRPAGPRPRRRLLLRLAIPVLALLATVVAMTPSTSPASPLYPLHQLFFDHESPTAADRARTHVADAQLELARAQTNTGNARADDLKRARQNIADARALLGQIADTVTRNQLTAQLNALERRADELDNEGQQQNDGSSENSTAGENSGGPDGQSTGQHDGGGNHGQTGNNGDNASSP
jgi:hypothetical protein